MLLPSLKPPLKLPRLLLATALFSIPFTRGPVVLEIFLFTPFSKSLRVLATFLLSFITMLAYSDCSLRVSTLFLMLFLNLIRLFKFLLRLLSSVIVLAFIIAGRHLPILPINLATSLSVLLVKFFRLFLSFLFSTFC